MYKFCAREHFPKKYLSEINQNFLKKINELLNYTNAFVFLNAVTSQLRL